MADALEKTDQRPQAWAEQTRTAHGRIDRRVMRFLASATPAGGTAMLGDVRRFGNDLHLLHDAWWLVAGFQGAAAVGTMRPGVLDAVIDLTDIKRRAFVPGVAGLGTDSSFAFALGPRRFDNIAGRRL